ncbi:general transcription factor 3C polypeptide 1 isoform X2 [Ischnura elegans]|uniref:general transcription factor 3C polypeptide 1 isoform X2 n=1 Tax=Ischnura elegans TaxID=197161 RepID=UPI001ED86B6A|nr:general transcription factor 3C polypeptide 1 isoform X2 [Ischnura elegans]
MFYPKHDYISAVLDEIALEGLDGITLQALWLRLSQRPDTCLQNDCHTKNYVWSIVTRLKDVALFELEVPRNDLVAFNRFDHVDAEMGTVVEPGEDPEDLYPYAPMEDIVRGIRGSCSTYHSRVKVNTIARTLTLDEAVEKWGNRLVIVASQTVRNNTLLADNVDPTIELTLAHYCVLERIGRSRYHGEITIGRTSLQQIGIDPKTLFYLRKFLLNHKLITKQIFHIKSGGQNSSGSLLHLARFYVLRRPKVLVLTKKVVEILKAQPGYFAEYEEIRQILGIVYSLKKLTKTAEFQKFVRSDVKLPYRTVYPEANDSEWKLKAFDRERQVRVVQLINPDVDVEEVWSKEEGEEEEDLYSGQLDQSKILIDRPLLCQAYDFFEKAGSKGLSKVELGNLMGLSKLDSRTICRNLVKCGFVALYMHDVGRQRVTRFVCRKFSRQGDIIVQYEKEKQKMIDLLTSKPEPEEPPSTNVEPAASSVPSESVPESPSAVQSTISSGKLPDETPEISGEVVETFIEEESANIPTPKQYTKYQDMLSHQWNLKKEQMTYRMLKRANIILECVKGDKVIYDYTKLMQYINEEEEREGYNAKIDKKSFLRLLTSLREDGFVKTLNITLKLKNKTRILHFICDPSIAKDDGVIQSAIEQAKVKFFIHQKANISKAQAKKAAAAKHSKEKKANAEDKEKLNVVRGKIFGKKYGFCPKFVRMKLLHRFLFYLLYSYEGEKGLDQQQLIEKIILNGHVLDDELTQELPTIYHPTICWKTFIPPLPEHLGFPGGWTFMSDWLLRIPLCIFVKIYNVTCEVPGLEEYLNHPIRQHYLLRSLPAKMKKYLMFGRRYIFNIHEIVCRLCFIGLLQFGPQRLKDKDQVFIYLNRKAILLDTTTSKAGYHQVSDDIEYVQRSYYFETMGDVDKYWYDMWNICLKTQLGGRMCVTGNDITLEVLEYKESMIEAMQPKNAEEAPTLDVGYIPGDHRGAAGLDSAIFSHLKRNWTKGNLNPHQKNPSQRPESVTTAELSIRATKLKLGKEKYGVLPQVHVLGKIGKVSKAFGRVSGTMKKRSMLTTIQNLCKKKVEKAKHVIRTVLPRKSRSSRPYYDEEDKKALAKMKKLRVEWTEVEDSLLLTCKVAGLYFFPNPRYVAVSFQAIRDVLHRKIKSSINKTSRACQRRILYMMRNPATAHSVSLSLLDLKHDQSIAKKFEGVVERARAVAKNKEQLEKLLRHSFVELVEILTKREESSAKPRNNPAFQVDDVEEFRSKYEIAFPHVLESKSRFLDVADADQIYKTVLHTIIHSSFCCSADKTSFAYQLFKVYQQYPDSFIKAAMNKFRSDQMVTLKKQYTSKKYKTGNFVPISSCPYQLSMNYAYLFQTEFQYEVFHQAYKILRALEKQLPECTNDEKVEILANDGGTAALLVEYFCLNKVTLEAGIPDQIIILDPIFATKKDTYDGILKRFRQHLEAAYRDKMGTDIPFNPLVSGAKKRRPGDDLDCDNPVKRVKIDDCLDSSSSLSLQQAMQLSRHEDTDSETPKPPDEEDGASMEVSSVNSDSKENEDSTSSEVKAPGSENLSVSTRDSTMENRLLTNNAVCAASRIALFLMRKELTESPQIDSHHAHDFFVVNACEIYCTTSDVNGLLEPINSQTKLMESVLQKIKSSSILPDGYTSFLDLHKKYLEMSSNPLDWKYACELVDFVDHAREVGVTLKELRDKFNRRIGTFSLAQHLSIIAKERIFIRAGVTCVRYVHYEYIKPWVVHSNKLLRLQKENVIPTEVKLMNLDGGSKSPKKANVDVEIDKETPEEIKESSVQEESIQPVQSSSSPVKSASEGDPLIQSVDKGDPSVGGTVESDPSVGRTAKGDPSVGRIVEGDSSVGSTAKGDPSVGRIVEGDPSVGSTAQGDPMSPPLPKKARYSVPKSIDGMEERISTIEAGGHWNTSANKIKVLIKPWIRVDGSINRRVFDRFLGAVLGHIVLNPGITVKDVGERFIPALQPFHTRELVEILCDLKCVEMNAVKMRKVTLFSKPSKVSIVPLDGTEDDSIVHLSPCIDAVSKLGLLVGDKKYAVDFLGDIL